jgi:MFS family permease
MKLSDFRKAGHTPTLISAFLYFDVSFMVWVLMGPLGPFIGEALKLSATQKGFLTAVPLLGGSFFRLILGYLTERIGARKTGLIGLVVTLLPLLIAWQFASTFTEFLAAGVLLGVAGASFAAALPLASAWYPPEYQGLAMGIAGAGNSGTLVATLFAPRLAQAYGWRNVFAMAAVPVLCVWLTFFFLAKDAPVKRAVKRWADYKRVLSVADTGWFCFILQPDLWRLRRTRELSFHLLPRSISDEQGSVRRPHNHRRDLRQFPPSRGRFAGRQIGRLSHAAGSAHRHWTLPGCSRDTASSGSGRRAPGGGDGHARNGKRVGISTGAATLPG